jgi:MFS family permease
MAAEHPATARARRGLDLLNFFIADVQTGFGPFVAVYLTARHWTQVEIGFALSLGTVTAMVSQVPAGALVDALHGKRAAAAAGIVAIGAAALLLAFWPVLLPVLVAQVLHGFASCVIIPAIAAISLGLVGHAAMGERLGRNARFAAIGNGLAAGVMGVLGSYVSERSVFVLTAALCVPALAVLPFIKNVSFIGGAEVVSSGPTRPRPMTIGRGTGRATDLATEPATGRATKTWAERSDLVALVTDRRLLVFAGCAVLFHLSNAAMLPIAAGELTQREGTRASLIIAACIVVPQAVVALLSPWVGRAAERLGRRPLLLLGWASLPLRGALLALLPDPFLLVALQALSGVSAAVFGVMLPLIADDVTRGGYRFNLCIGIFGLAAAGGATFSTTIAGWLADTAGDRAAFLGLALAGLAGTALVWLAMPETRSISAPE